MTPTQTIPPVEPPVRKGLSWPDVQALGLVLLILMVINLPLYQSVLQVQGKPAPTRVVTARTAPVKTAFVKNISTDASKTAVSSLTKTSDASNRTPAP